MPGNDDMRLRDLLASMVPPEKLGEAEFTKLHRDCRAELNLPNGGYVADLTPVQKEKIAAKVTPVQRRLLGKK